ncbi:hypothetical protein N0V92_001165, partial [Colletotrichum tropicale]
TPPTSASAPASDATSTATTPGAAAALLPDNVRPGPAAVQPQQRHGHARPGRLRHHQPNWLAELRPECGGVLLVPRLREHHPRPRHRRLRVRAAELVRRHRARAGDELDREWRRGVGVVWVEL